MTNEEKIKLKQISILVTEILIENEQGQSYLSQKMPEAWARYQRQSNIDNRIEKKQVSIIPKEEEELIRYKNKTIKKRADGRYWTRYYQNGKQAAVYGRTQAECLKNLKFALSHPKKQKKENHTDFTFKEWLDKWIVLYKKSKVKASTLYKIEKLIETLQPFFNTKLSDITPLQIQEFLMSIEAPRRREQVYDIIRGSLTKAESNDLIIKNPCRAIEIPRHKATHGRAMTQAEEQRFIEACEKNKYGIMFLICLYQGLRIGELRALELPDIDFENNTIFIDKAVNDLNRLDTPKSQTSVRTVPLFERTKKALNLYGFEKLKGERMIYELFRDLCIEANVRGYTIHSLRHTFATRCAEAGVSSKVCQKWLGHSTISMTLDIYTHINSEFEQKAARDFDSYFDTH